MIRVTKVSTRPNTGVNWWFETPDGIDYAYYRNAKYGSKLSDQQISLSPNGLTWTYSVTWSSRADYDAMMADPFIQSSLAILQTYKDANGFVESPATIVEL